MSPSLSVFLIPLFPWQAGEAAQAREALVAQVSR